MGTGRLSRPSAVLASSGKPSGTRSGGSYRRHRRGHWRLNESAAFSAAITKQAATNSQKDQTSSGGEDRYCPAASGPTTTASIHEPGIRKRTLEVAN
mmetsp:Transcript_11029/g.21561  ORF Transcript_11029/g.21561 Transcript_11029/m.21561 type:complete len:97 (-) Transcript_11029:104-394(-)